jgi:hypothetical protein
LATSDNHTDARNAAAVRPSWADRVSPDMLSLLRCPAEWLAGLVRDLDSDSFQVREEVTSALAALGV